MLAYGGAVQLCECRRPKLCPSSWAKTTQPSPRYQVFLAFLKPVNGLVPTSAMPPHWHPALAGIMNMKLSYWLGSMPAACAAAVARMAMGSSSLSLQVGIEIVNG